MVPLVVGLSILTGNVSSAVSLPDHLRSVDKMHPDSCLSSVLLIGVEAALKAEGIRGWLGPPEVVALLWDVVSDANEFPVGITDWESDSTMSANVFCGSGNEPSATITDIAGRGVEMGRSMACRNESILTSHRS